MTEAMLLSSSPENGKSGIPLKRTVTTGLVRVATDQGLAGFVPRKHLWSQMNAPMVSPARATLTGGDVIWRACQSWPESFSHQKRTEQKQEERKIFPSQLSFQRERKFAMVDLNTFSIISKQEVSPAAVFSVGEGVCLSSVVKDKCYTQFSPLIFDLKQKLTLQMSYDIVQFALTFYGWPRGILVCPL